jgi:hypothetical protein
VNNTAGTWFAIIGGGLLIYFLAQALSKSGSMISSTINSGVPGQ